MASSRRTTRAWIGLPVVLALVLGGGCSAWPRERLVERALPAPALVYGRPLVLAPGLRLSGTALSDHLRAAGYRRTAGAVSAGVWKRQGGRFEIERRPFRDPDGLSAGGRLVVELESGTRGGRDVRIVRLEDETGAAVPAAFLEPPVLGTVDGGDERPGIRVALDRFPAHVVEAVLATEDRRFRRHPGVDPIRIVGAWRKNRRAGRIVEGASTITQQFAKNVYLTPERTWSRKFREVALSVWLELRYSKGEILEAYLNQVYLGQDRGRAIHGFGDAAWFYFRKDVADLDVSDAALLAGIIRAPNAQSPFRHPQRARARRDQVLGFLRAADQMSEVEHANAVAAGLRLRRGQRSSAPAGYFLDWVRREAASTAGSRRAGASLWTTLDLGFQRAAEAAVRGGLRALEVSHPQMRRLESPVQAALVALDPQSGDVLAYVGGRDFSISPFDRASRARRQPGSVFKPFVALAALSDPDGRSFTLETILEDEPLELQVEGRTWAPANYDHRHCGPVTLRRALVDSLNVPFVRLGLEAGLVHVAETARGLGIEGDLRPVPSLSLGAFEMTPLEVASAYAVLADGGRRSEPRAILATLDSRGGVERANESARRRVVDSRAANDVTRALQEAVRRGTGRSLAQLGVTAPVAGKTGTTNDFRDAWFVGYSPDLVVAVWVGFDDAARVGLTGARAALPIFARFVRDAVGGDGLRDFPSIARR